MGSYILTRWGEVEFKAGHESKIPTEMRFKSSESAIQPNLITECHAEQRRKSISFSHLRLNVPEQKEAKQLRDQDLWLLNNLKRMRYWDQICKRIGKSKTLIRL